MRCCVVKVRVLINCTALLRTRSMLLSENRMDWLKGKGLGVFAYASEQRLSESLFVTRRFEEGRDEDSSESSMEWYSTDDDDDDQDDNEDSNGDGDGDGGGLQHDKDQSYGQKVTTAKLFQQDEEPDIALENQLRFKEQSAKCIELLKTHLHSTVWEGCSKNTYGSFLF